ncbi:MAG: DUF4954 family protein [Chitinispirillales bacterium]|jgi:hypothetical protein|nr:DUF4954 family protein [Chitinispirillales bacterium]
MEKNVKQWRNPQNGAGLRALRNDEIAQLTAQLNTAADWGSVRVADGFDAGKVRNCGFDGRIEIGTLTLDCLRYGNVTLKTGLYGSSFKDTSIGDNTAIHNLLYCCGQEIGNSVIIANVSEISSGNNAAFGMSIDKDDGQRIEIINENGGRAVLLSPEMTCTGAYLWAKFRDDAELMAKFAEVTRNTNRNMRPPRAIIADNAVILNTKAVRDTLIGPATVIDGAELIHNSTILSDPAEKTIVGPAVQIRNSIIGYGNGVDSAAQLNHVMTGTAVSLSKSTRITHSFVGDCANIACCEIANCLIMPFHVQHHNNSFLIAAAVGGQSNIAAGAVIGSNHNSRVSDGEIWAKRGFWPGLCVSLKHNSRFASFTMIAKGDYPKELDIKLPFSLVTLNGKNGAAATLPAFWFTHNMYAAMRCAQKFVNRDKRAHRQQFIEHDILAPDTVEEMFEAIHILSNPEPKAEFKRVDNARNMYRMMIRHYCAKNILPYMQENDINSYSGLIDAVNHSLSVDNENWLNCGSMVISETALSNITGNIKKGNISTWSDIQSLFDPWASTYQTAKVKHALQSLAKLENTTLNELSNDAFLAFLHSVPQDCRTIAALTLSSRSKDFSAPPRIMAYQSKEEMSAVLGPIEDSVIKQVTREMNNLTRMADTFFFSCKQA